MGKHVLVPNVRVCMCCTCAYIFTCVLCAHQCSCTYMCTCVHIKCVSTHVCACMLVYICTCVCMLCLHLLFCVHSCVHSCVCLLVNVYVCTCVDVHVYLYICICVPLCELRCVSMCVLLRVFPRECILVHVYVHVCACVHGCKWLDFLLSSKQNSIAAHWEEQEESSAVFHWVKCWGIHENADYTLYTNVFIFLENTLPCNKNMSFGLTHDGFIIAIFKWIK